MKNIKLGLILVLFLLISSKNILLAQKSDSTETVDPKVVLEKYLEAIGGRDALSKVADRTTIMRGTAMGQNLTIIVKQKAPNKMRQEVKAGGMDQTIIFDGEKGVMKAATQKVDVTGKELKVVNSKGVAGYNTVTIEDLNTTGVLSYRLQSDDFVATKKMVSIK